MTVTGRRCPGYEGPRLCGEAAKRAATAAGAQAMLTIRSARLISVPSLIAVLVAACSTGATTSPRDLPSPSAAPPSSPAATSAPVNAMVEFNVYFLMHDPRALQSLVSVHRSVLPTNDVAAAAIRELLAGPTAGERSGDNGRRRGGLAQLSTALPNQATLLAVDIQGGIATVDLSGVFDPVDDVTMTVNRQAQIVYTLTQFPTIDGVVFLEEGKPVAVVEGHEGTSSFDPASRGLYFDQRRSVFVEEPSWGFHVGDSIHVSGETTREGDLRIALVDGMTDGILAERTIRAACDPCIAPDAWGAFETDLSIPTGSRPSDLRLRIWEPAHSAGGTATAVDYPLGSTDAAPSSTGSPNQGDTANVAPFDCALSTSMPGTSDVVQITGVRVGTHGDGPSDYDRAVFEFSGSGIPEILVGPGTPPFTQDPSDLPLAVRGSSFLVVVMHGASMIDPYGAISYGGPTDFTPDFPAVSELRAAGDFERVSSWVIGLKGPSCHRVYTLTNPTRLVIDVQHPQD
jgi:hypothetical protein